MRRGLALRLGLAALLAGDLVFETQVPRLETMSVETSRLPEGARLRVLQLSDVHGHRFWDGGARLHALIAEAQPDAIALTGDMIDHGTADLAPMWALAERLVTTTPAVYYVPGNHEWWNPRREAFVEGLRDRGVTVLVNRHVEATIAGVPVTVAGVDDAYTGRAMLGKAVAGAPADRFTLLLSHSPAPARGLAGTPVDLMLAGHTHGGQVRLPVVGALMAPGEGFFPHFDRGLYALEAGKRLYIDSGLGTSLLPLRFLNRSQLSLITILGERPSR